MQLTLGVFVVAAVVWALLNLWYVPALGKFSCSYVPYFAGTARADTGDSCPESLRGAMTDAQWAADRYAEIDDKHDTTGLFFDEDGHRHTFVSGDEKGADADRARRILAEVGATPIRGQISSGHAR